MAVVKSSSPAAALLMATLLLFAAASAAAARSGRGRAGEPGCPADIDEIIVNAIRRRELSAETLAEFDELSTDEVYECVCDNIVEAAGITSASPGAISTLVDGVLRRLARSTNDVAVDDCNPTLPNQ